MSEQALTRSVKISNRKGLHARASAKLARLATTLPTQITVHYDGETADARSIMDLLCLGAAFGATITITASKQDGQIALDQVEALINDGFGELQDE
ncbi:MAG: HPr family phosphocarrier protein [Pseudomonadota bacterium]